MIRVRGNQRLHDLPREQTGCPWSLGVSRARQDVRVTGLRRVHIVVLLHPVFTQVRIELDELRLGIGIALPSRHRQTVIEQQQIPGVGESVLDPLNVVVAPDLLVAENSWSAQFFFA